LEGGAATSQSFVSRKASAHGLIKYINAVKTVPHKFSPVPSPGCSRGMNKTIKTNLNHY
jgi:hypothetical protein